MVTDFVLTVVIAAAAALAWHLAGGIDYLVALALWLAIGALIVATMAYVHVEELVRERRTPEGEQPGEAVAP